jgi:hypothetical protein
LIRKSSEQQFDKEYEDACSEKILKEKKRSLSRQTSVLDFFKPYSVNRASPPVLLDIGDDAPDDLPTVQEEVLLLKLSFACRFVL